MFFFVRGRPEATTGQPLRTGVRGVPQPRELSCGSALAIAVAITRGLRERLLRHGLPDPPCWPPASGSLRTLVPAPSIKRTSLSNPVGPRRGGAAGQHHPALRVFYTPTLDVLGSPTLADSPGVSLDHPEPAPCHCCGDPQQIVPRVAQSVLGPAGWCPRSDTTHPARGRSPQITFLPTPT